MRSSIFLVGPRASGKTTLGRALAEALEYRFVDTDRLVLESTGMTVAEIVEREGWDGFRRRESEALRAAAGPATVVATGGGMVLSEANRAFMRANGKVFYLSVPVALLAARLEADPNAGQRPTLTGRTIVDEVSEVLASREAFYREVADHVLDASLAFDAVLDQALRLVGETGHRH